MKKFTFVTIVVSSVLLGALVTGQKASRAQEAGQAKGDEPEVVVAGIEVFRPDPSEKQGRSFIFGRLAGTTIHLLVKIPRGSIVAVERGASVLKEFADDKNKPLGKPGGDDFTGGWLGSFVKIAEDRRSCTLQIESDELPSAAARELRVRANLVLTCGSNAKTSRKNVTLEKGKRFMLGSLPVEIADVGESKWQPGGLAVELVSSRNFKLIRELTAVGPDGKPISVSKVSSSRSSIGKEVTYTARYELDKKVTSATFKVSYFEKTENVSVPIDLTVGVGL
ncbi:MAG: hypothetical protein ACYTF6_01565 [Planctomycetota bacterium]|jgi:hypothetical protein